MARKMKDSGIEWIGEIPEGWEVSQLKYATRWKSEKGCPDAPVLSLYRDFGVVPKDSRDDNHNVTSLDTSNYKVVDIGDLVINKMKAWQGSMAVSDYRGIVSPAYHVCSITSNKVNKRYLHHLLRNPAYLPEYARLSTGMRIGQWDLGFDDFKNIPFLIPPLDEQAKIADYLDNGCASLDAMLSKTRSSIEEYKKLKQTVITQAVTKGVRGEREMKPTDFTRWSEIPFDWDLKRVKSCIASISSGLSAVTDDANSEESGKFVLRTSAVSSGFFVPTEVKPVLKSAVNRLICPVEPDTLIVSRMNTASMVGACAYVANNHPNTFLPDKLWKIKFLPSYHTKYMWYALNSVPAKSWFSELATGASSSMQNISINDFTSNYLPIPAFSEQKEIANYLDAKCAEIDGLIAKKEQLTKELESYKKSLIYEVVTGKREV